MAALRSETIGTADLFAKSVTREGLRRFLDARALRFRRLI